MNKTIFKLNEIFKQFKEIDESCSRANATVSCLEYDYTCTYDEYLHHCYEQKKNVEELFKRRNEIENSYIEILERILESGDSKLITMIEYDIHFYKFVYRCECCHNIVEYCDDDQEAFLSYRYDKTSLCKENRTIARIIEKCYRCRYSATTDNFEKPDNLFNTMIVSHGMMTGFLQEISGRKSIENLFVITKNYNNPHFEICCSHKTQHIGKWGIYLKGTHTVVSNMDLYSQIHNGRRVLNKDSWKVRDGVIYKREDYKLSRWGHVEHIVIPRKIIGVWIKKCHIDNNEIFECYQYLKRLCKSKNWILHLVK